ncbi:UNVERIFIED_CONTAM: hypothetical protein H355_011231 [Colinus virginianus]|nr:hypothetical protein H355_011231 [Colinus virginianus]
MSSSGRLMVRGIEGEMAGARQSSHSPVWSSGNKQVETRNERQSKTNRFKCTANTQKWTRGVVYLGHIPSGFNEPQMFRFFSQFGEVGGVVLRRSRKTGHSKGYGYVGFEVPEVAEVVAETMNNYMMFGRTLACHVVAPSRVPPRLFRNWGKKFRRLSTRIQAVQQHNKPDNVLPSLRQVKRRLGNEKKVARHLKNVGLEHVASALKHTVWKNDIEN